ncbi:MAG: trypsin-like serine peptidase [Bacteriovoracaceae bacterium]|jgi:V8-like Glu-specific endopeptidase
MANRYVVFSVFFLLILSSCQNPDQNPSCDANSVVNSKIIIGTNDWINYGQTGDDPQNANERTVAQVKIPALMASCSGFLINSTTLMTNNHCIGSANSAVNVTALFREPDGTRETFVCNEFIMTSSLYDFTLVKCKNNPGLKYGWVGLSKEKPVQYSRLYLIQENCDYIANPRCTLNKYVSFGEVLRSLSSIMYHNADTLGGSSGSPIFSEDTHQVLSIHNAGSPPTSTSPAMNQGVPMYQIRSAIEAKQNIIIHEFGTASNYSDTSEPVQVDEPEIPATDVQDVCLSSPS